MSPAVLSSPDSVTTTTRIISPLLDRKIDENGAGLLHQIAKSLHSIGEKNAAVIIEYIAALKSEINLSDHYRRDLIVVLCKFSKYNDGIPFKESIRITLLRSYIASARQRHKTLCTNG